MRENEVSAAISSGKIFMANFYIYILSNKENGVLYIGITNNLEKRVWEHKEKVVKGFTNKYNVDKLVYYEIANGPTNAIAREKQLKAGSRKKKLDLISKFNPRWVDLYYQL